MKFLQETLYESDVKHLISLPDEKLIFASRKHKGVIIFPLLWIWFFLFVIEAILLTTFLAFLFSWFLYAVASLFFISLTVSLSTKLVIDWYCHFYIVTNRKIMEINSAPLFSHSVNNVFLDHVRVTEINVSVSSFVQELIRIGNVSVTFDRQYQDEEFVLTDIPNPQEVGRLLGDALEMIMYENPVWYTPRSFKSPLKANGEIYAKRGAGSL